MHKNRFAIIVGLLALLASTLACSLPIAGQDEGATPGEIATAVAATLAAAGPAQPPLVLPTLIPDEPTPTPGLDLPPTPTPTPPVSLTLAYRDGAGNLWAWIEGGSPRQLTSSGDVGYDLAVSSDGVWIAFTRHVDDPPTHSLWAIRSDGAGERELVSAKNFADWKGGLDVRTAVTAKIAWASGTHTLVFTTQPLVEYGMVLNYDLRTVDADTGALTEVLPIGAGGMFTLSPDGRQVALATPSALHLMNLDGTNLRSNVINYANVMTYSEYAYHLQPVWAADSSRLRVHIPPADPLASPRQATTLWTVPADGSPAQQTGSVDVFFLDTVLFAPAGEKLLHVRPAGDPTTSNDREMVLSGVDGGGALRLDGGEFTSAAWSPDGRRFSYLRNPGGIALYGQPDSGSVAPLTDTANVQEVLWVDANRFFFSSRASDSTRQIRLGTPGGASQLVAEVSGLESYDWVAMDFNR